MKITKGKFLLAFYNNEISGLSGHNTPIMFQTIGINSTEPIEVTEELKRNLHKKLDLLLMNLEDKLK